MRIICSLDKVAERLGFDPVLNLLIPNIRLDSPRMATPMVCDTADGQVVLAREQELGNLKAQGVQSGDIVVFEPYVTLGERDSRVRGFDGIAAAVTSLSRGRPVEVDGAMPVARFKELPVNLDISVVDEAEAPAGYQVTELDLKSVMEKFQQWGKDAAQVATSMIRDVPALQPLADELKVGVEDTRFAGLELLAERLSLAAILLNAPPNFSEVTARQASDTTYAVWVRDGGRVFVIEAVMTAGPGTFGTLPAAIASVQSTGRLGIEDEWLGIGVATELEATWDLVAASSDLAHWRDARDNEDLGSQTIVAQASTRSIEFAIDWGRAQLDQSATITERAIYDKYLEHVRSVVGSLGFGFQLEPYFVNLHAADRTIYPGPPVDHQITSATKSIKLDAGLALMRDGVVLATSDMARSLMTTPEGQEAYSIFHAIVRDVIIQSCVEGAVCEDVHTKTIDAILEKRSRLIQLGVLSEDIDFAAEYRNRNVGHLMGKQESFVTELRPGHKHVLSRGAIGAAEIQWSFGEYSIGIEDMWFIGRDATIVTTMWQHQP